MKHQKPIRLVYEIKKTSIYDAPEPLALILGEKKKTRYSPFPLSPEQQFELLYLVRTRKSGIITREELQDIIFVEPTLH